jgi:tRNA uridine 5-carbamoylmethylation protein Kti12
MPLVTLCGLPCSGKTHFARGLIDFIQRTAPEKTVVLVDEEELHITKAEGYRGTRRALTVMGKARSCALTLLRG